MKPSKIFQIIKYVQAESIGDAIKKEKDAKIDGVIYQNDVKKPIGF